MGVSKYYLSAILVLAACVLLPGCSVGQKLPASWPEIGITLPSNAQVKKLDKAFRLYTHDGTHAYKQDGRDEIWALCFDCTGGISQAYAHINPELLRSGFSETTIEEFPHTLVARIAGVHNTAYVWLTESERTGVTLLLLDSLDDEAREEIGGLCLIISTRGRSTASGPEGDKADNRCF